MVIYYIVNPLRPKRIFKGSSLTTLFTAYISTDQYITPHIRIIASPFSYLSEKPQPLFLDVIVWQAGTSPFTQSCSLLSNF